jgi:hypothetical protein
LSASARAPGPPGKRPQRGLLKSRAGQSEFLRGVDRYGVSAIVARRQYGKTTIFAKVALKKMMKTAGHTVIFGSAKLNLSREIVRKEAEVLQQAIGAMIDSYGGSPQADALRLADSYGGSPKELPIKLSADDFAELFEAQRLEFRFHHSRSVYSRTKVVALRPDTVGETGDLMCDEVGRIKNWVEVCEAVEPIVQSNPEFRWTMSTTPPPDDTHYSFEQLAPPVGIEFPVNPNGNWYRTDFGIWVLRVDAYDAFADGVHVYDLETRQPLDPTEHRRRAHDKDAWDRNYGVKFITGGTAAVGLLQLMAAQQRGVGHCACVLIEDNNDLERAANFLKEHLGPGPVGAGWDLATTEKEVSNPSALAFVEQRGFELIVPLIAVWKTKEPDVARERLHRLLGAVKERKEGGRARRLCIDATNERYFATEMRKELSHELPVELVIGSETIQRPGMEEPMTMKQFLGGQLVDTIDDNQITLPAERYVKEDFRLVRKERGQFVCDPAPDGKHGDTFDATKLGQKAVSSINGAITEPGRIHIGSNSNARIFQPRFWNRPA